MDWLNDPVKELNKQAREEAASRQQQLTKPQGALGRLESLSIQLAAMHAQARPGLQSPWISVFAADHGIAAREVSAYPQAVTVEMIRNFSRGGAAINVIAAQIGADLEVVNVGSLTALPSLPGVVDNRVGPGTADFSREPAMTRTQLSEALSVGREAVRRAAAAGTDMYIAGEMGIGNSAAASAIMAALLQMDPLDTVGPGTGIGESQLQNKINLVREALRLHQAELSGPMDVLRCLGGFEIAAITGAYIHCAQLGLPFIVDGFISSSAFLIACRVQPRVNDWGLISHLSAEPGHRAMVAALGQKPLLDLQMRLGEGTGAALCVHLVKTALALHNNMATFAQAQISDRLES